MKLSRHFDSNEFKCKCGRCVPEVHVSPLLIESLEKIRSFCGGASIRVNSGIRCLKHNKAVGGVPRSQHILGTAADITIRGKSPHEVYRVLNLLFPDSKGIGRYNTFTHFDVRPYRARWG